MGAVLSPDPGAGVALTMAAEVVAAMVVLPPWGVWELPLRPLSMLSIFQRRMPEPMMTTSTTMSYLIGLRCLLILMIPGIKIFMSSSLCSSFLMTSVLILPSRRPIMCFLVICFLLAVVTAPCG